MVDPLLVSLRTTPKLIGLRASLQDSHQKVVQRTEQSIVLSMEAHKNVRIVLRVSRVVCTMADVIMAKQLLTNACLICPRWAQMRSGVVHQTPKRAMMRQAGSTTNASSRVTG